MVRKSVLKYNELRSRVEQLHDAYTQKELDSSKALEARLSQKISKLAEDVGKLRVYYTALHDRFDHLEELAFQDKENPQELGTTIFVDMNNRVSLYCIECFYTDASQLLQANLKQGDVVRFADHVGHEGIVEIILLNASILDKAIVNVIEWKKRVES